MKEGTPVGTRIEIREAPEAYRRMMRIFADIKARRDASPIPLTDIGNKPVQQPKAG